jgi:hypothetical protein
MRMSSASPTGRSSWTTSPWRNDLTCFSGSTTRPSSTDSRTATALSASGSITC